MIKLPACTLATAAVYTEYGTSEFGISTQVAQLRLKQQGLNTLPKGKSISRLKIFLSQFTSPLVFALIAVAIFSLVVKEPTDAVIISVVLLINAIIGFLQEYQASRIYQSLSQMIQYKTLVFRDGQEQEIASESVVVGDLVILTAGAKIPADIRLTETQSLEIDESAFTGESLPALKDAQLTIPKESSLGDRKNMAYMGTLVLKGRARGIVVATGIRTELGALSEKVLTATSEQVPLQKKMHMFILYISLAVLISSLLIIFVGLSLGMEWIQLLRDVAATIVATIPESLPILVTVALAIGVKRMAKVNAVIRHLPVVETLGSATVICTDKTGTLTMDQLTMKKIHDGEVSYEVTGVGTEVIGRFLSQGKAVDPVEQKHLRWLLLIGMVCTESTIHVRASGAKLTGDPTERALLIAGAKAGLRQSILSALYPLREIIPFESGKKYMATLHTHNNQAYLFVKGAPEVIFALCRPQAIHKLEAIVQDYSKHGLRVLCCAYKKLDTIQPIEKLLDQKDLVCAGVCGLEDVPRHEVLATINQCKGAGIRVVMITGDHAVTAKNIAVATGIAKSSDHVIDGKDLTHMTDETLSELVGRTTIFARVAPKDKLRIVDELKKRGEIVAVIGDGVNDAPALRSAHIGVAMGKKGTDLAREAADIVLLDDRFATLVSAIKQGRIVFDNIRKACVFLIPTGFAAVLSVLGTMLLGLPIPYLPLQLLWINLVTNGIQGVAMAFEKGETGILHRPPLPTHEGILSRSLIWRSILVSLTIAGGVMWLYLWALEQRYTLEHARTLAVTVMVFFQLFQTLNARSEFHSIFITPITNKLLFVGLVLSLLAHVIALYTEPVRRVLVFVPLAVSEWTMVVGLASSVIVVVELDKLIRFLKIRRQ